QLPQFNIILTIIIAVIGVVASIFTLIYAVYMIKEVFWGDIKHNDSPVQNPHEPFLFTLPSAIMMILLLIVFFVPSLFVHHIILPALLRMTSGEKVDAIATHISQWSLFNLPLLLSFIVIVVGFIAALIIDWKKQSDKIRFNSITDVDLVSYKQF